MTQPNTLTINDLLDLTDQAAIVTGAGAGIGRAIALRFGEAGAAVLLADVNASVAHETRDAIVAAGGQAEVEQVDIGSESSARRLSESAVSHFGRLDILVNNAGIYPHRPFFDLDVEEWERVMRTNLTGTFLCAQAAAREMVHLGSPGSIVNLASTVAWQPSRGLAHYTASKGGILALTRSLAIELAGHEIRGNAVSPGSIDVRRDVNATTTLSDREAAVRQTRQERIPLGRLGTPDEIARAVLFLASSAAAYVTGAVLAVDGGLLVS